MPSPFAKQLNYNDLLPPIVLAVPHAAGATTLVLPAGAGTRLGTLAPDRFFRVTALRNPGSEREVVLCIYKATGIDVVTSILTGVTGDEGFSNVALPAGTTIEVRPTAKDYEEHSVAINANEAAIAAFAPPTGSLTALQIQALIDAAANGGPAAKLPGVRHLLDRPLRISQSITALLGDPGGGTILESLKPGGMPTIFIAPFLDPAPVLFDGQMSRYVNLRDTRCGDIDGLTSLSIAFDFNLATLGLPDDDQVFLSSGGSRQDFDNEYTQSLRLSLFNGALKGRMTTGSGVTLLSTPMGVGPRHVEFSYDGSTVRLLVDGSGPSAAATGPIVQGFYEDFALGATLYRWPDGVGITRPVTGVMTNFVMTGPGAGPPLFNIPSFVAPDQLIPCDTAQGAAILVLKKDGNGAVNIQHCRIADLQINAGHGHGILATFTQVSILERLQLFGRQPLTLWNNSYINSVRDLSCYAWSTGARYGMAIIGGTNNEVRNINVSVAGFLGGVGIVANGATGAYDDCVIIGGSIKLGFLCKSDGGFQRWTNGVITDENQAIPSDAALLFSGIDAVLIDGGGSYALASAHPLVILSHCKAATIVGHHLGATAGATAAIAVTACGPVVVESSPILPDTVPYGAGVTSVTVPAGSAGDLQFKGAAGFAGGGPAWDGTQIVANGFATISTFAFNADFSIARGAAQRLVFDYPAAAFDFAGGAATAWTTWVRIRPNQPTTVGLDIRAFAGQSAPLVRCLASDGTTVLASIGPAGTLTTADQLVANAGAGNLRATIGGYPGDNVSYSGLWFAAVPGASNFAMLGTATGDTLFNAAMTLDYRIANVSRLGVNSSTITTFGTIQCLDLASSVYALRLDTESSSRLFQVESTHAGAVTATFKAIVGQSANVVECLTSINTVTFSVGPTGTLTIGSLAGLLKATAGVVSAAAAGTDYLTPSGDGSGLTALNASALASGTVPTARLPMASGRLAATVTTTSSTLGTNALTGLGFAIGANEVWAVEWNLTVTGSAAGMKFDVTGPTAPTDLRASIVGNTTAITATSAETLTAFSAVSAAYVLYATTSGQVRIVACVANGANAGTVQLRFGSTTAAQSNSVLIDSYMTARRIG